MKYTIYLNQEKLLKLSPKITLDEAVILNYIIAICCTKNSKIENERIEGYTWIDYSSLLKHLPLLRGKTPATIVPKLKKLEQYKYITTMDYREEGGVKKYVKLLEKCDLLEFSKGSFSYLNDSAQGVISKTKRGHLDILTDNTISNNTISDTKRLTSLMSALSNNKMTEESTDKCKFKYMQEFKGICPLMQERGWCDCGVCAWTMKSIATSLIKTYGEKELAIKSHYYALMATVPNKWINEHAEEISAKLKESEL